MITTGDFGALSARLAGARWRLMTPPQHLWFFSQESMRRMASSLGFKVEHLDHPWKMVPLSLISFQLARMSGLHPHRRARVGRPGPSGQPVRRHARRAAEAEAHERSSFRRPDCPCLRLCSGDGRRPVAVQDGAMRGAGATSLAERIAGSLFNGYFVGCAHPLRGADRSLGLDPQLYAAVARLSVRGAGVRAHAGARHPGFRRTCIASAGHRHRR